MAKCVISKLLLWGTDTTSIDWKYVWLLRLQSCFFKGRYIITCLRDVPKKARAAIQTCTRESFKLNFIQKKKVRGFYVQWLILITCNKPNIHSFSKYFVYFQAKHTFFFCCRLGMAVGHIIPTPISLHHLVGLQPTPLNTQFISSQTQKSLHLHLSLMAQSNSRRAIRRMPNSSPITYHPLVVYLTHLHTVPCHPAALS